MAKRINKTGIHTKLPIHTDAELLAIQAKYFNTQSDDFDTLKDKYKESQAELNRVRHANIRMAEEIFSLSRKLKVFTDMEMKRALIGAQDY